MDQCEPSITVWKYVGEHMQCLLHPVKLGTKLFRSFPCFCLLNEFSMCDVLSYTAKHLRLSLSTSLALTFHNGTHLLYKSEYLFFFPFNVAFNSSDSSQLWSIHSSKHKTHDACPLAWRCKIYTKFCWVKHNDKRCIWCHLLSLRWSDDIHKFCQAFDRVFIMCVDDYLRQESIA